MYIWWFFFLSCLFFVLPGPSSPDVTSVEVSLGRSLGITVYWIYVQGATNYLAWTSNGQNCSTESTYCFINPQECGQNHTVTVIAYNNAGPSSPSQPTNYITCGFHTQTQSWVKSKPLTFKNWAERKLNKHTISLFIFHWQTPVPLRTSGWRSPQLGTAQCCGSKCHSWSIT